MWTVVDGTFFSFTKSHVDKVLFHKDVFVPHLYQLLTVMIDGIDESQADVCVVVGHEHDVKELLALGVKLPQLRVHSLQSLAAQQNTKRQRGWICA